MLQRLNPLDLRVDRGRWWFEHSVLWLRVWLSADGAKSFFWPWLASPQGWGSLTMGFTGKFVYGSPFHLLQLNPLDLSVYRERWWFEHSVSTLRV